LRDAHYQGAKRLGHGEGYKYAHDFPEHFVAQDYLGAEKRYYEPSDQGNEKMIKERVEGWRAKSNSKIQTPNPKAGEKSEGRGRKSEGEARSKESGNAAGGTPALPG